jgi:hypothetical protein
VCTHMTGTRTGTVAEAKAEFSELLHKTNSEGPQKNHEARRTTAVVVCSRRRERNADDQGTLAELRAPSPLRLLQSLRRLEELRIQH